MASFHLSFVLSNERNTKAVVGYFSCRFFNSGKPLIQSGHHDAQTSITIAFPLCLSKIFCNEILFPSLSSNSLFNVTGLKALLFLETLSVSIAKESFNSLISSAILASTFLVSQLTAIIPNAKRAINTFFISFQFYFWI